MLTVILFHFILCLVQRIMLTRLVAAVPAGHVLFTFSRVSCELQRIGPFDLKLVVLVSSLATFFFVEAYLRDHPLDDIVFTKEEAIAVRRWSLAPSLNSLDSLQL